MSSDRWTSEKLADLRRRAAKRCAEFQDYVAPDDGADPDMIAMQWWDAGDRAAEVEMDSTP